MRKKIIAANWKMHMTTGEAESFLHAFLREIEDEDAVEVVLLPPFTSIAKVSELLTDVQNVKVGAQNMHPAMSGAFTGEISAPMLRELYVRYVVLGHSERRQLFGDTDAWINEKVRTALDSSLRPILCVGETLDQREAGEVEEVLNRQLGEGLSRVSEKDFVNLVVAYEPVWAIGTGKTASPEQAAEAHGMIRRKLVGLGGEEAAAKVRIQYGGSVKPDNAEELLRQPDVDGALVGGASLDPRGFAEIVAAAVQIAKE